MSIILKYYVTERDSLLTLSTPRASFLPCQVTIHQDMFIYCLELVSPIPTNTNNPSWKSVVLESPAKPSLGCQFGSPDLVWQKIQELLTPGENLFRVVGIKALS